MKPSRSASQSSSSNTVRSSGLVRILPSSEVTKHKWTGNDKSQRNRHQVVHLSERKYRMRLLWKTGSGAKPELVGVFELDLAGLLKANFVREDPPYGEDAIRLRFVHDPDDDGIYIQVKSDSRHYVGTFRCTQRH